MAQLLETALYNALKELREAQLSVVDWDFKRILAKQNGKRAERLAAEDGLFHARKRVEAAEDAADELLARTADDYQQVAEQFGGSFFERD